MRAKNTFTYKYEIVRVAESITNDKISIFLCN